MEKVESFKLNHNKVKAPYVRKCCVLDGRVGDKVSKFDLRFLQPNIEAFGTGFYLIMWGDVDTNIVKEGLEKALQEVIDSKEMVAATAVECGNYRDLSLFGAQEYAKKVLKEGFSLNIYGN
ncbi:MAG: S-ribosylhomocysteine lyase [Peptostreptococcaceae bacterium]